MNKYSIRFNKSRGQAGRGTPDHAWRVFENDKEYLVKHLKIDAPTWDETDGFDWNIVCHGTMTLDRETSTAIIVGVKQNNKHQEIAWNLRSDDTLYKSITINNLFSADEIELIKKQALLLPAEPPTVRETGVEQRVDHSIRICKLKWMFPTENTNWIYRRLVDAIQKVNSDIFNLNLYGLQTLQYTIYNDTDQGFYGPHRDVMAVGSGYLPRKLSFSLQLTDPAEYEGGDLIYEVGFKPYNAPKELGSLNFFTSDTVHEAQPVTKGSRHVLVGWVAGPPLA